MALPTDVAPELLLLTDDALADLRALTEANLPHRCSATYDARAGVRVGGALVRHTDLVMSNVPCRLVAIKNRLHEALDAAQPFQPDQWALVFRVGVDLPEGAIATITGTDAVGNPWARVVRVGTPMHSRAFEIESRFSARDKLAGLAFSVVMLAAGLPKLSRVASGTQRFIGSRTTGLPALSRQAVADNGIFFRYVNGDSLAAVGGTFTGPAGRTYIDNNGVLQTVGANVLRDGHYIGGRPWTLLEAARTFYFANSTAPASHTSPVLPVGTYILWLVGTGSIAVAAGSATITGAGTATAGAPVVFNVTVAGTVNYTVTGTPTRAQVENGAFASSFFATTAVPVTRAAESLSFTRPFSQLQVLSMFVKGVNLGTFNSPGNAPPFAAIAYNAPRFWIYNGGGSSVFGLFHNGTTQVVANASVAPANGDTVEALATLSAAGVLGISAALNGGAPSAITSAAANLPIAVTPGDTNLSLNSAGGIAGFGAFDRLLIVRGVKTFAQMRAFT